MGKYPNDWLDDPLLGMGLMLLLLIPVLLLFAYLGLASDTYRLLGLSESGAIILMAASLIGSQINIPLSSKRIELADPDSSSLPPSLQWLAPYLHYRPPRVTDQVLAVNVGGCVVPVIFTVHLLTLATTSVAASLCATAVVVVVVHLFARRVPGEGITLPAFVPALVAALVARGFANAFGVPVSGAAPVAYIAGTMGTLIGADLLNLPAILRGDLESGDEAGMSGRVMNSIGGAGVFDGIFVTGIVAPILATF